MQSACVRISNTPSAPKVRWDKTTELLHISQSAISRHMAQLEDELRRKGIRSWALFPMWQNKRESPRFLAMIEFFIGYWQNGIAFMVLALLASPIGLSAIANLLLNLLDHLIVFLEGLVC